MPKLLYFAYGSNLHKLQFKRRCRDSSEVGRARLPEYRLAFTRYSTKRKGGVADIVPEPGAEVWGALYEITAADLEALDTFENVPRSYRRENITVFDDAGAPREAVCYFANKTGAFAPSKMYLELIVNGAVEHGLPDEYVTSLRDTQTYA